MCLRGLGGRGRPSERGGAALWDSRVRVVTLEGASGWRAGTRSALQPPEGEGEGSGKVSTGRGHGWGGNGGALPADVSSLIGFFSSRRV